jgi:hypothetical protein
MILYNIYTNLIYKKKIAHQVHKLNKKIRDAGAGDEAACFFLKMGVFVSLRNSVML